MRLFAYSPLPQAYCAIALPLWAGAAPSGAAAGARPGIAGRA